MISLFLLLSTQLGCQEEPNALGWWDAIEKDGMQFPIVLEGDIAQEILGDPTLQKAVQEMQIEINEDGTGTLVSHFAMTSEEGEEYNFSYPMPMTTDITTHPYVFRAVDSETAEEIEMTCVHTQADILNCQYTTNDPEAPEGTLNFMRPTDSGPAN